MGLGKTIQSIALLLTNPRPSIISSSDRTDDKHKDTIVIPREVGKGTLVVAPLALIKQWEGEIASRVESSHELRVCVHHGPQRTKRSHDLRKYDVVITTYQILVSEHGNSSKDPAGPQAGCFGVYWYRVILDEAHSIKNRNAKATQAACALQAEYRWCLTGTPMQNNLDELQSLIKFLRIKPYDELPMWKDQIIRPLNAGRGGVAMRRLQVVLKTFMKRRTKDVLKAEGALNPGGKATAKGKSSNGFKIVDRKIEKLVAEFAEEEFAFYQRLEERADASLEKMMGGSKMSYASALTLLLRLRQACNHPELVMRSMRKDKDAISTELDDLVKAPVRSKAIEDDLDDVADLLGGLTVQTKQCDVCQQDLSKQEAASGKVHCADCEKDLAMVLSKKKHKHRKHHKKHKDCSRTTKGSNPSTSQAPSRKSKHRPVVQDSDDEEGHAEWIVPDSQQESVHLGQAGGTDDENAEEGGESLGSDDSATEDESQVSSRRVETSANGKQVICLDSEDDETPIRSMSSHKKHASKPVMKERKAKSSFNSSSNSSESGDEDSASDSASDSDSARNANSQLANLITSTKVKHLLRILRRDSPTYKFIVFSEWTSMLDLIEPHLKGARLRFTRYDGSMRNDAREASLSKLRNDPSTRILLCSLKCGSLGLNLTAASRVVILEPFWNPFVEEQAIDRVHRLNQTTDVVVYKLTVKGTVEERIVELQERKRALAKAALEGGKAVMGLSMQDILALFKRDAEHDMRWEGKGHDLLGEIRGVLSPRKGAPVPVEHGRRTTPPVMERGKAAVRKEDAVYGRRW